MKSKQYWILGGIVCLILLGVARWKRTSVGATAPASGRETGSSSATAEKKQASGTSTGVTKPKAIYRPPPPALAVRPSRQEVPKANAPLMDDGAMTREQFKSAAAYYLATEQSARRTLDSIETCVFGGGKGQVPQLTAEVKSKMNPEQLKALEKQSVTTQTICVSAAELIAQKYPSLAPEVERKITRRELPEAVKKAIEEGKR